MALEPVKVLAYGIPLLAARCQNLVLVDARRLPALAAVGALKTAAQEHIFTI